MRRILLVCGMVGCGLAAAQTARAPFTLAQILSVPYALDLTAAPVGGSFAWIENAEGVRNIWVGGAHEAARKITPYSADDGQDINGLTWSSDASAVAYAYGAPNGANGKPANPAHLQRPTPVEVIVQPLAPGVAATDLGEGHAPLFSHDGRSVMFVRGGEIWSAQTADGAASAHRLVYDRGAASGLTLSPDGTLLAYTSRRGAHSFIALFDLRAKTLTFVSPSVGRDFAASFSPDGKRIAWLRAPFDEPAEFAANRVSANPWSVMVTDVSAPPDGRAVFTPEKNKPGSVLPHTATGEPRVWWMSDTRLAFLGEMDGWVHLYAVGASGGETKLLSPGRGEVEDVTQGPHEGMVWASNVPTCAGGRCDLQDEDRRHLWTWTIEGARVLTRGENIEVYPQVAADGTLAALVSDAKEPMYAAWIGDYGTDTQTSPTPLHRGDFEKRYAGYPGRRLVEPKQVFIPEAPAAKYLAQDDVRLSLHGQLFEPRTAGHADSFGMTNQRKHGDERKHPAVIFFHGGPMRQMLLGYPAMEYYSNAYAMNQYLASRGFIVLSVNYHCGVGYGTDFRQCERAGADGASEYADVLAAVRWLRAQPDVDAKRIGVWGGSYGGYLTALALARNSNLFAAGVDFHGVHDWILEDNNADWLRGSNAEKDAIAKIAHAASPMADIAKWTSPILLIHGDNDANVAFNQTPALADALQAKGVDVEELIFPDEIHEFLLHSDWLKAYAAEAEFFERVLKP